MRIMSCRTVERFLVSSRTLPSILLLLAFAAGMLGTNRAFAQFTTARLGGNVTDNTGSAIPGAKVTVRETTSEYRQTLSTGGDGAYLFPSLPVGSYELTVDQSSCPRPPMFLPATPKPRRV